MRLFRHCVFFVSLGFGVSACNQLAGLNDLSVEQETAGNDSGDAQAETGDAGTGDASVDADSDTDAATECDGGTQPVGANGEPCCTPNELACGGHAQKLVLICDPKSRLWAALQSCSGKQLCDSQVGTNQGSCQDPVGICIGKLPGDQLCSGLKAVQCGPDLVTSEETTCANACKDGACVGQCTPGARHCALLKPELCDEKGSWQSEASCAYVCTGEGQCSGECTPGNKQCNGNKPQHCDNGLWISDTACGGTTPECSDGACVASCTDGLKQCSNKTLQKCVSGAWQQEQPCPYLCSSGACSGACSPGSKQCEAQVPQSCDAQGVWQNGTACQYVCSAGSCSGACMPGTKECSGLTPRFCDNLGQWQSNTACAYLCSGGACAGLCTPGDKKCNGQVTQSCDGSGQWVDGSTCEFVCTAGTCAGACAPQTEQCNGLALQTCNEQGAWDSGNLCPYVCSGGACAGACAPGSKDCEGLIPRSCDANGAWQSATSCQNKACVGGTCQGVCAPSAKQCSGNILQTCQSSGQWDAGIACSGGTPVCSGGQCVATSTGGASCAGVAATCGAGGNGNCCASSVVPGGTYARSGTFPAKVSDFRLDIYETTVGRFRKFVAAYSQTMTASGAGKNPNNAADTGWNTAWNTKLPANAASLTGKDGLLCDSAYQTWTPSVGAHENHPINCVNWYEAYAFCIWDGGRLPTEAEWEYAATGGSEQRIYPWGSAVPGNNTNLAVYGCYYNGTGTCTGLTNIAQVGAVAAGNGRWGQSDLAGNMWEWAQDYYNPAHIEPCDNCALLTTGTSRIARGSSFMYLPAYLGAGWRMDGFPESHGNSDGMRCARTP